MTVIHHTIELSGRTPLAQGTHCHVYAAPFDPELVIKVIRRDLPPPRNQWKKWKRALHGWRPALQDRPLIREYAAYIALRRTQIDRGGDLPVAHCAGVVATDHGLGILYEKISEDGQELGPSVSQLASGGQLEAALPLLTDFARRLFDWDIRANDVNRGNIVLGNRNGRRQFVLVDGLGDSHLIPLRAWFRRWNHRSLNKRFAKVARRTALKWDSQSRQFLALTGTQSTPERDHRREHGD